MPRILHMQNKYSTTELNLQSFVCDPESHHVAKADLELKVLLPLPLKWWDYGYVPPHMANLLLTDAKLSFQEESQHFSIFFGKEETELILLIYNVLWYFPTNL